jgi:hypothetical protein
VRFECVGSYVRTLVQAVIDERRRSRLEIWVVGGVVDVVVADDIRRIVAQLPRAYEVVVGDRVKWRVGRLVFASLSRDETLLGFAYPREEREALVASDPVTFLMPLDSDLRYHWVRARMAELDADELRELIESAWTMAVPKSVAAAHLRTEEDT